MATKRAAAGGQRLRPSGRHVGAPKLKREVGLLAATIYGIGIILGAGVYALVGVAAGTSGNAVWLAFLLSAIVSSFTGLSYMELVSMFPKSAAEYTYLKNALKKEIIAFNAGWIEIFADTVAAAAVSLGFAGYFVSLMGTPEFVMILGMPIQSTVLISLGLIGIMSFINFWGISESAKVNTAFSIIETLGLVLVIFLAFGSGRIGTVDYFYMPEGITGVLTASALIFFAFIGFEDLANISEEVKNPTKNVPRALMYSLAITAVLYVLVGISVVSLESWEKLAVSKAPLAEAVASVTGNIGYTIMSVIALFATANTVLVTLIVSSRGMYGMSSGGSLPRVLSKVHPKRNTPWIAVLVSMTIAISFVLMGHIEIVASITDFATFYIFIFVNAAAIILRYKMPDRKRPFKTPISIGKMPLLPLLGLLSSFALVLHLHLDAIIVGIGIVLAGFALFPFLDRENK